MPCRLAAPKACPTRTVAAWLRPTEIVVSMFMICRLITCAARASAPSQPIMFEAA